MKISSFQKNLKKLILYLGEKYLPKNKINSFNLYPLFTNKLYNKNNFKYFLIAFFISRIIFKQIYKLKNKQLKMF